MAYTISARDIDLMNESFTNPIAVNVGCIGEICALELTLDATGGDVFTDKEIIWNTALFKPVNIPTFDPSTSNVGWVFDSTGKAIATTYGMDLNTNGNEDSADNSKIVTINYVSATQIKLLNEFYLVHDVHDFIKNGTQANLNKFRRNSINSLTDFENVITSVYNTDRGLWSWININTATGGGSDPANCCPEIREIFTSQATVADGDLASPTTLGNTPLDTTVVRVYVDGRVMEVGDGVITKDCYFSGDGGVTARGFSSLNPNGQIQTGDELYWNGSVVGFEINTTMRIMIYFLK